MIASETEEITAGEEATRTPGDNWLVCEQHRWIDRWV